MKGYEAQFHAIYVEKVHTLSQLLTKQGSIFVALGLGNDTIPDFHPLPIQQDVPRNETDNKAFTETSTYILPSFTKSLFFNLFYQFS
jgi:hypothetical protein